MENPPFEDVFPIQDGDFPLLCLFTGGYHIASSVLFQVVEGREDSVARTRSGSTRQVGIAGWVPGLRSGTWRIIPVSGEPW